MSLRIFRIYLVVVRACMRAGRSMLSFLGSLGGAAMLLGGASVILTAATAGSLMTNYAFKEAQLEELRAALRASVSAAGPLLAGAGGALDQAIKERVAEFLAASLPGMEVTSNDVTVEHDATTRVTTIGIKGNYPFQDLWVFGEDESIPSERGEAVGEAVAVKFEVDRYEVGIALDISASMAQRMPDGQGGSVVKIEALKDAMTAVVDTMGDIAANHPGSVMASIVPFGTAVNVADTCSPDPNTGLCRAERSAGKDRYVRMLAGPHDTMAQTLTAASNSGAHWVDTYHHYGASEDLGPLAQQSLPQDLLNNRDWNLRRTDVEIDLRAQAPSLDTGATRGLGYWRVNDEDFWNGCVMARWGSYWDPNARPPGWTENDPDNWPAQSNVPGWSSDAGIVNDVSLHLSDAPPDASDPRTLFTAYSWPDARISGTVDHRLQSAMVDMLEHLNNGSDPSIDDLRMELSQGDNNWSFRDDYGGADQCPSTPITPLTDDFDDLRAAALRLRPVPQHGHSQGAYFAVGGTNLSLGAVWGLRTISPLWREIWDVADAGNSPRPGIPCAPGETSDHCDDKLNKSILIVSDGRNDPGSVGWRFVISPNNAKNPKFTSGPLGWLCRGSAAIPNYKAAARETTESRFNNHFSTYVDTNGQFTAAGAGEVADIVHRYLDNDFDKSRPNDPDPNTSRRSARVSSLVGLTPWQLFRAVGSDAGIETLVDPANQFGVDGRPVRIAHICQRSTIFTPYGRVDDSIRVGESGGIPSTLLPPAEGVSPLSGGFEGKLAYEVEDALRPILNDWFHEACRIAGLRRVRVNAVFIGDDSYLPPIDNLKQCVQLAGGDPDRDVHVTPSAKDLHDTFVDIFAIQRNLRFLH